MYVEFDGKDFQIDTLCVYVAFIKSYSIKVSIFKGHS